MNFCGPCGGHETSTSQELERTLPAAEGSGGWERAGATEIWGGVLSVRRHGSAVAVFK